MTVNEEKFITSYNKLADIAARNAEEKGFCPEKEIQELINKYPRISAAFDAEKICLMHSELSEALEGRRIGDPPDDKINEFTSQEVELADIIIRIMYYGVTRKVRIAEAVDEKIMFNPSRTHKHGGKIF